MIILYSSGAKQIPSTHGEADKSSSHTSTSFSEVLAKNSDQKHSADSEVDASMPPLHSVMSASDEEPSVSVTVDSYHEQQNFRDFLKSSSDSPSSQTSPSVTVESLRISSMDSYLTGLQAYDLSEESEVLSTEEERISQLLQEQEKALQKAEEAQEEHRRFFALGKVPVPKFPPFG